MYKCIVCGKELFASASKASHMRKHVRDGSVKEQSNPKTGLIEWVATGKEPHDPKEKIKKEKEKKRKEREAERERRKKLKEDNSYIRSRRIHVPSTYEARQPSSGQWKKNDFYIQCKKCKKWSKSRKSNALERFMVIHCCDVMTMFAIRAMKEATDIIKD